MSNTDLVREVDEELRHEQYQRLWERYRSAILTTAAVIVLVVAGFKGWQAYLANQAAAAGSQFEAATSLLAGGKTDEATKALEAIVNGGPGAYATLASLKLAAQAAQDGKTADAAARYDAIAGNTGADANIRGFALIQSAALKLDTTDFTAMQNQLNDLLQPDRTWANWRLKLMGYPVPEGTWRNSARELLGLSAYKAGKLTEADDYFAAILGDKDGRGALGQVAQTMREMILAATAKPPAVKAN